MESVFNIEPNELNVRRIINDYQYDFFHTIDISNKEIYYDIINSYSTFKIKNIYNFIYLRIYKLNKLFDEIDLIEKYNGKITPEIFNTQLKNYINDNIIKTIIIMNSIQIYIT